MLTAALDISDTIIFSPGKYGEYLSRLDIAYNLTEGRIVDSKFTLIPVDDTIKGDPYVQGMVEQYHAAMDLSLTSFGVELTSPISRTDFSMEMKPLQETGLGNLTADANRTVASMLALGTTEEIPYAFSVVPTGMIRDNLYPGKSKIITFTDTYNVLPLGISPDPSQPMPGHPLMSVYLTAPEIRNVCEAGLTLAPMMGSDNYLNFSGVRVDYDPSGAILLQGVTAVYLCGNPWPAAIGGNEDIFSTSCETELDLTDADTLYRCVVDLYALQMMHVMTAYLPIVPKDSDGMPVDMSNPMDYMQCRIDSDNATVDVEELKEWMPLLNFLGTVFPASGDGIPESVYGTGGTALGRVNLIP